jgi:CO/xanthine dehydrogenase Mo-binding subunit
VLDKALALADWAGFAADVRHPCARPSCAGWGFAASSKSQAAASLRDTADLRFEADGKVALRLGAQAIGQDT